MQVSLPNIADTQLLSLNVLVQVTILAVCVLTAARLFQQSAITRWWLLGTGLLLILMSPLTALIAQSQGIGVFWMSQTRGSQATVEARQIELQTEGDLPTAPAKFPATQQNQVARLDDLTSQSTSDAIAAPVQTKLPTEVPATDSTFDLSTSSARSTTSWLRSGFNVVLLVWLAGALWNLLRMAVGWGKLSRLRSQADKAVPRELAEAFESACDQIQPGRRPTLLISDRVGGPVAAGIFRPVVILPESMVEVFSSNQWKDILLHEVAHVARHDQMVVILQNVLSSLFWLHPLVRIVNRQFAQAREEVCDNFVLKGSSGPDYSRTLLYLAQHVSGPALPASVGMLDDWRLESRVAGLLQNNRNTDTRMHRRGLSMIVVLLIGLFVAGVCATISVADDEATTSPAQRDEDSALVEPKTKPEKPVMAMKAAAGAADSATSEGALPASTQFEFAGKVIGPNKQPVAGAEVYIARMNAQPLATTDANGRFTFTRLKKQLPNNASWGLMKLVAVKDGFGIAYSPILRFEQSGAGMKDLRLRNPNKKFSFGKKPAVLRLVRDDAPIRGTIVDLEGEPITHASVQLRFVDDLYARFAFDAVTTDAQGRFEIHGIGNDRVVRLVAKSERSEFSVLFARTADVPTETKTQREYDPFGSESDTRENTKVTYGANFTHAVGPSVPLEGRVTDSRTGKPLADVVLSGDKIGNYRVTPAQEELSAVTDGDGRYRLCGLPLGSNQLFANLKERGYLKRRVTYNITDENPVAKGDFTMLEGIVLSGQVTDQETGEPIPGLVEYYAAKTNDHFTPGLVNSSSRTGGDGRFSINVSPGEGYLAFRSRRPGYAVGVFDRESRETMTSASPFLRTKTSAIYPFNYHMIRTIDLAKEQDSATQNLTLKRQPEVTAKLVDTEGKPVNRASIVELVTLPLSGFARGSNSVKLTEDTYQCRQFTPDGTTDLIARHEERGLIGRLSLGFSVDPDLPIIMKTPELAAKVKIDRVRVTEDCDVQVTMRPAATLRGRVVGKDGKPRVVKISGHERPFNTDDDGRFELSMVLPNFPLRIRARHPDRQELFGMLFEEVILEPGEVRELGDIQVKPFAQ